MRPSIPIAALLAAAAALAPGRATGDPRPPGRGQDARAAAVRFLESLGGPSRARSSFGFDDPLRQDWHFIPRARSGLPLSAMNDAERSAAHGLLRAVTTPRGYERLLGVIRLEGILRDLERAAGGDGAMRDPGLYHFSVFGDPSGEEPFGLRVEGHHLSFNLTTVDPHGTSTTPFFLGANPAEVPAGASAGWKLLAAHEELARALVVSLTAEQRARAILAASAPPDVLFGPGKAADPERFEGLPFAAMEPAQRRLAARLVAETIGDVDGAEARVEAVLAGAADGLHFAWAGGLEPGQGHYWRITGEHDVIEYDNTQNGANHVHLLWRDRRNDLGADWLARHHAEEGGGGGR